jgi:hypothetical protein
MSDTIEPQESEPAKLDDELSDEALDRESGDGAPFCCVSTRR